MPAIARHLSRHKQYSGPVAPFLCSPTANQAWERVGSLTAEIPLEIPVSALERRTEWEIQRLPKLVYHLHKPQISPPWLQWTSTDRSGSKSGSLRDESPPSQVGVVSFENHSLLPLFSWTPPMFFRWIGLTNNSTHSINLWLEKLRTIFAHLV